MTSIPEEIEGNTGTEETAPAQDANETSTEEAPEKVEPAE